MRAIFTTFATLCLALPLWADDIFLEGNPPLEDFLWQNRPLVVFADTPNDPRYVQQLDMLRKRSDPLAQRDVVVLVDTDPDGASALRKTLRPRGFMLALIGKDGRVVFRKPAPWDVREITRAIDKIPLRQQEIRDTRAATGG